MNDSQIAMASSRDLLRRIARCANVSKVFGGDNHHACADIVLSQGVRNIDSFQVPEPWNGDICSARLLYLSSNPSISGTEEYPRWDSQDQMIEDFFVHRFGGGIRLWVKDGKNALARDGTYLPATAYWSEILNRSIELYGRQVMPGKDYAITEIVHCKSRNMIGVDAAITECSARYLLLILNLSNARVVVSIGKKVGDLLRAALHVDDSKTIIGPRTIAGKQRLVLFLAAPGSSRPRVITRILTKEETQLVRGYLNGSS